MKKYEKRESKIIEKNQQNFRKLRFLHTKRASEHSRALYNIDGHKKYKQNADVYEFLMDDASPDRISSVHFERN